MNSLITEQIWWHVARASGITALLLTGGSVIWGLLLSTRVLRGRPTPAWLLSMHRFLGAMTVTFTGVHIAGLVADNYVHFGWLETLVPFTSAWQPFAVGLGVIAMYLLIAVQASSMMMRRIPRRWWKTIHQSSFLLFLISIVHGVQAGTDAGNPLYIGGVVAMVSVVLFLTVVRLIAARDKALQRASRGADRAARSSEPSPIG